MRLISDGGNRFGVVLRTLVAVAVVVLIVLVTLCFLVRTEGGRDFIEERLSKRLGMTVDIEKARIGFPYALVIENMRSSEYGVAGAAGISVAEIRIARCLRAWSVGMRRCSLRLKQGSGGGWKPAAFARIGDWLGSGMDELTLLTACVRDRATIDLQDSEIAWLAEDGSEVAALRDIDFSLRTVEVENRVLYYYALAVYSADGTPYAEDRDMRWEWLATDTAEYIEIARSGRSIRKLGAPPANVRDVVGPGDD